MAEVQFPGGDRLGGTKWTLDEFLDASSERIVVIGPHLNRLASDQQYWSRISEWLQDRSRSLTLVISKDLTQDRWPQSGELLAMSKRVFARWTAEAHEHTPPLNLTAYTLRAIIRTSITIVNPNAVDALAVVVPLITQPISADKFFIVIKKQDHPGIYESVWQQVQDLMTAGREPLPLPKRE